MSVSIGRGSRLPLQHISHLMSTMSRRGTVNIHAHTENNLTISGPVADTSLYGKDKYTTVRVFAHKSEINSSLYHEDQVYTADHTSAMGTIASFPGPI